MYMPAFSLDLTSDAWTWVFKTEQTWEILWTICSIALNWLSIFQLQLYHVIWNFYMFLVAVNLRPINFVIWKLLERDIMVISNPLIDDNLSCSATTMNAYSPTVGRHML